MKLNDPRQSRGFTCFIINTKQSSPHPVLRLDPHPAWDRTWRYVTFNAFVGGTRRVFVADMGELIGASKNDVPAKTGILKLLTTLCSRLCGSNK
jgi:hypothetical protein